MEYAPVTCRPLVEADLERLHQWLNDPEVVRWWEGDDVSWDAVVRDHWTAVHEEVEHWIGLLDGEPVGWIQCYPARTSPEESAAWFPLGVDEGAAGIDYLVGSTTKRGRGLGSSMIRSFALDTFDRHPSWTQVCAGPYSANVASCRALARAGFDLVGTYVDDAGDECSVFALARSRATTAG